MSQPLNRKPPPARLPESDPPLKGRRTGSRSKDRAGETRGRKGSARADKPPASPLRGESPTPEIDQAVVEREGSRWTVRVLGQAGGPTGGRSPPILLLGFWPGDDCEGAHEKEATVVGRSLSDLTPDRLDAALADASLRRDFTGRKPFFDAVGRGRRVDSERGRTNEPDP